MDVEDAHPLKREAYLDDIWPCIKLKERQPDFKLVLKNCFHKELDIKVSISGYGSTVQEDMDMVQ